MTILPHEFLKTLKRCTTTGARIPAPRCAYDPLGARYKFMTLHGLPAPVWLLVGR